MDDFGLNANRSRLTGENESDVPSRIDRKWIERGDEHAAPANIRGVGRPGSVSVGENDFLGKRQPIFLATLDKG